MKNNKKVCAIILAAGKGIRMNGSIQKPYIYLNNKPIILYSLLTFQKCEEIDFIILVVREEKISFCQELLEKYNITKLSGIIKGGEKRQDSVFEALKFIHDNKLLKDNEIILIHDSARPLLKEELIKNIIFFALKYKSAIPAIECRDTIKLLNKDQFVKKTFQREKLRIIQTPQGFEKRIIYSAYKKLINTNEEFTDDASLLEKLKIPVKTIPGHFDNIKITYKEDIELAEFYLTKK